MNTFRLSGGTIWNAREGTRLGSPVYPFIVIDRRDPAKVTLQSGLPNLPGLTIASFITGYQ
jgi:hypothetical protein